MLDPNAIHVNTSGEIAAIAEKAVPVNADLVVIEDSAAGNAKKKVQIGNLPAGGGGDPTAIHDDTAGEIHAIAAKAVPVAADELVIEDSAAAWAKKRIAISSLPTGADATAIHDDQAGEIHAIAAKAVPVAADELVIEDSEAAWVKKRVALTELLDKTDAAAIHDNVAGEISAVAEKAVPVAADLLLIEDSAAANAKKKVQIGNLPGGGGGLGYALPVSCISWSPNDAQNTFFGCFAKAPDSSAGRARIYIPKAGTIKVADIWTYAWTAAGTNEDWSLYVRLNNTTDTLIATVGAATADRRFVNTALAIAVAQGDYIEIKSVAPTWATNPTGVYAGGCIYIE